MPFVSEYEFGEVQISVEQRPEGVGPSGQKLNANSGTVWDAALVLCHYLPRRGDWRGRTCVELGCGTGIVGLTAAGLGAEVVATDFEEVCGLAEFNAEANAAVTGKRFRVMPLDWNAATEPEIRRKGLAGVDIILGSDLVCGELYARQALATVLQRLLSLGGEHCSCILSHERRDGDRFPDFERQLSELGLTVSRIPRRDQDPVYSSPDIDLLEIRLERTSDQAATEDDIYS
eukprot:Hpha_TRINITY_DN16155_c2_g2::TRINITY_DN16155_c2_g2_i1::g.6464::m.6464